MFGLAVVAEYAVAFVRKAAFVFCRVVVVFFFAVAEEAAVLATLISPTHLAATVLEYAEATARDHDVELALFHVATDVRDHNDELLALDCLGVCVRGVVVAFTGERQLEALAALAAVACGHCREGESHVVTAAYREGNLADAGHLRASAADAPVVPVRVLAAALVGALLGVLAAGILVPGTAGLAAVPVARGPAAAAAALCLNGGASCGCAVAATAGAAGFGLLGAARLRVRRGRSLAGRRSGPWRARDVVFFADVVEFCGVHVFHERFAVHVYDITAEVVGDGADDIAVHVGDVAVVVDEVILVGVEYPGHVVDHLVFARRRRSGSVRDNDRFGDVRGHDVEFAQLEHLDDGFVGLVVDDGGPGSVQHSYGGPFGVGDDF